MANFTGADLTGADFTGADLSADMKNQSMGLMRGVLRQAKAAGAVFFNADMASARLTGLHNADPSALGRAKNLDRAVRD